MARHYDIRLSLLWWFFLPRWNVYELGHTDGDERWLASFKHREDAAAWIGTPHD